MQLAISKGRLGGRAVDIGKARPRERQNEAASELQQLLADVHLLSLLRAQPFDEESYFGFANPPGSDHRGRSSHRMRGA